MIAADVMTRNVISVPPDAIVSDAVQLMLDNRISGLFVVDSHGTMQGVITEGDLLHREEVGTGRRSSWWLRLFVPGREASDFTHNHSRRIADLMTTDVISVEHTAELAEVVQTMERNHVKRVPVMQDGRIVGVISRANLLRALSAVSRDAPKASMDDRSIQQAIMAALDKESWAPVARMDLTVLDGVVEIWGTVTSEDERRGVCVIAENTAGVKRVIDHMVFMDPYSGLIVEPGLETPPKT